MFAPSETCGGREEVVARFLGVRGKTEELCRPLVVEDYQLQSMADCSPPKWHLGHTTWFFERFLLAGREPGYRDVHPQYNYLFNSYYDAVGARWPRGARGLLSRPTVAEVWEYRRAIDGRVVALLREADEGEFRRIWPLVELGLNHEQQHQELLLTDLKHAFGLNPLRPVYAAASDAAPNAGAAALRWTAWSAGVRQIGHGGKGVAFDNEGPAHKVYLQAFEIASRLVINSEFVEFIDDGGYERPEFWLSDGWAARQRLEWAAPLYWRREEAAWRIFTLRGERDLDLAEPVCHVSYYEADAFARWRGARLPTEQEWEVAAGEQAVAGNLLDSGNLHPAAGGASLYGDVWVWTASPYSAYPGYRPAEGALGEYNGKFMCNQMTLRGGSCVTPAGHVRSTYRNFFPPEARWQFSGLRLAKDGSE